MPPAAPQILGAASFSGLSCDVPFEADVPGGGTLHLAYAIFMENGDTGDTFFVTSCEDDCGEFAPHSWYIDSPSETDPIINPGGVDGSFVDPDVFEFLVSGSVARPCAGAASECHASGPYSGSVHIEFFSNNDGPFDGSAMIVYIPAEFFAGVPQNGNTSTLEYANGDAYWPGDPGFGSPTPGALDWSSDPFITYPYPTERDAFCIAVIGSDPPAGWSPSEFTLIGTEGRVSAAYGLVTAGTPFDPGGSGGGESMVVGNYALSLVKSGWPGGDPGEGLHVWQRF